MGLEFLSGKFSKAPVIFFSIGAKKYNESGVESEQRRCEEYLESDLCRLGVNLKSGGEHAMC